MKVKIITDGTIEGTQIINLRTGEELKNVEIVEFENLPKYNYENDLANVFHSIKSEQS